ncbi:MAG: metalloregulator ArsR/SmtB family transcription factor [Saprospiraceae bacterium]|nr:metalloregulator ArsR/SmtB family transcription factor [Saprospiraceae bacterium]
MNKHTPIPIVSNEQLRIALRILRALAHPLRIKIIRTIHQNKEGAANVGEIYTALEIEQSIASQHLRVLRHADLVVTRRDHKFVYYSLNYERISRTTEAISILKDETEPVSDKK